MIHRTLLLALVGVLLPAAAATAADHDADLTPRLTVRNGATLEKPADELQLDIGVVTEATTAGEALEENTKRMERVVAALEKAGLGDDEMKTGRFQVRPQYARRPRQPDPDWSPRIVGYEVTNSLRIRTGQLALAGRFIETANSAGANTIGSITFGLADPRAHRAEAIATATANAITDARGLAEAASLRLVRVLSINLDSAAAIPVTQRFGESGVMRAAVTQAGAPTPISPGDVTVKASVTIVYEVEGKTADGA
jgi:uncharacterized protein YggE